MAPPSDRGKWKWRLTALAGVYTSLDLNWCSLVKSQQDWKLEGSLNEKLAGFHFDFPVTRDAKPA